jgi:ribosomal protein S18 acetylase RimI-like enzyme
LRGRPIVRDARRSDARAVAAIVYESAPQIYDRLVGGRERAVTLLSAAFEREGTDASAEVVTVAELDGDIAAVLAAYPAHEAGRRATGIVGLLLARTAPWRWPGIVAFIHRGRKAAPAPPEESFYVDSLATDSRYRRRGAARALLGAAEQKARELGLSRIALDTELTNSRARPLYESEGYVAKATGPRVRGLPQFVLYVKDLTREGLTHQAP